MQKPPTSQIVLFLTTFIVLAISLSVFAQTADARLGTSIALGDFNGDGYSDIAIGVPNYNLVGEGEVFHGGEGAVFVYMGSLSGTVDSPQIFSQGNTDPRFSLPGSPEQDDRVGASLAVGDFDNDGFDDLAISAPGEAIGDVEDAGYVMVVYGSSSGLDATSSIGFDQSNSDPARDLPGGVEEGDSVGASLAVGDFDNDSYDDLAIGAPEEAIGQVEDAGFVMVVYGSRSGLNANGSVGFDQSNGEAARDLPGGAEPFDWVGTSLATGDFNNDGYDDLAIGAPGENNAEGFVMVVSGSSIGLDNYAERMIGVSQEGKWTLEAGDQVGAALSAGDFNNDGYDDLAIGAPGENNAAGFVMVVSGSSIGLDNYAERMIGVSQEGKWTLEAGDQVGAALSAGDFNNDGYDDLAIGAPGENNAAGFVMVVPGSLIGLDNYADRMIGFTPTNILFDEAILRAEAGVSSNEEWQPFFDDFGDGVEMVLVPVGCFSMGSENGDSDERPAHQQCVDEPFWIDRYEVTRAQYAICVNSRGCESTLPSDLSYRDNQPVNRINWFQAKQYCEWRSGRLPTEMEWEYAAKGPSGWTYAWGNDWNPEYLVWDNNANPSPLVGYNEASDVGSIEANKNWIGAFDMTGNLLEWTSTIQSNLDGRSGVFSYPYLDNDGRENPELTNVLRVLRGGSFIGDDSYIFRTTYRYVQSPGSDGMTSSGVRCVRDSWLNVGE